MSKSDKESLLTPLHMVLSFESGQQDGYVRVLRALREEREACLQSDRDGLDTAIDIVARMIK